MTTNIINGTARSVDNAFNGNSESSSMKEFAFINELLSTSDVSSKSIINKIIAKSEDEINIFEHYADLDETNIKFLLTDVSGLLSQINKFVDDVKSSPDKTGTETIDSLVSFFDKLFAGIDSVYSTNLKETFSDNISQLLSSNEIDPNQTNTSNSAESSSISKADSIISEKVISNTKNESIIPTYKFEEFLKSKSSVGTKYNSVAVEVPKGKTNDDNILTANSFVSSEIEDENFQSKSAVNADTKSLKFETNSDSIIKDVKILADNGLVSSEEKDENLESKSPVNANTKSLKSDGNIDSIVTDIKILADNKFVSNELKDGDLQSKSAVNANTKSLKIETDKDTIIRDVRILADNSLVASEVKDENLQSKSPVNTNTKKINIETDKDTIFKDVEIRTDNAFVSFEGKDENFQSKSAVNADTKSLKFETDKDTIIRDVRILADNSLVASEVKDENLQSKSTSNVNIVDVKSSKDEGTLVSYIKNGFIQDASETKTLLKSASKSETENKEIPNDKFLDLLKSISKITTKTNTAIKNELDEVLKSNDKIQSRIINLQNEETSGISELKSALEQVKTSFKYENNQQLNSNIADKFSISYLLEKLANIGENTETPAKVDKLPEMFRNNLDSSISNENITRYLSTATESIDNSPRFSANSDLKLGEEVSGIEKLFNFSQSGESFNRNEKESSNMDTFKFLSQTIMNKTGILAQEVSTKEVSEQGFYNQTFKSVRLQDIGRTVASFARNVSPETGGTARLILDPASLGTVFVEIKMKGNTATVNFKASSNDTLKSIEGQIGVLKEKLQQNGIETSKIEISLTGSENDSYQLSDNNRKSDGNERRSFLDSLKHLNKTFELEDKTDNIDNIRLNTGNLLEKYV